MDVVFSENSMLSVFVLFFFSRCVTVLFLFFMPQAWTSISLSLGWRIRGGNSNALSLEMLPSNVWESLTFLWKCKYDAYIPWEETQRKLVSVLQRTAEWKRKQATKALCGFCSGNNTAKAAVAAKKQRIVWSCIWPSHLLEIFSNMMTKNPSPWAGLRA